MSALAIDGEAVDSTRVPRAAKDVELLNGSGERIHVRIRDGVNTQPAIKISFLILGAVFVLLGAAVLLRRPDLWAARMFSVFGGMTSIALAVGTATVGAPLPWPLIVQFLSVVGVAGTLPLFAIALVDDRKGMSLSYGERVFVGFATLLVAGYLVSVVAAPDLYGIVRVGAFIYVACAVLGSLCFLILKGVSHPRPSQCQAARLALFGIAVGTVPSVFLTLIPEALGWGALVPAHLTVLFWGFIPATFAYAILQHQLLGIRRLVHRGMVDAIASTALLVCVSLGVTVTSSLIWGSSPAKYPAYVLVLLIALAAIVFHPVRSCARWLVDRFIYRDIVDSQALIELMRDDLITPHEHTGIAGGLVDRLAQAFRLESAILMLDERSGCTQVAAMSGRRAREVLEGAYPRLHEQIAKHKDHGVVELRWAADTLVHAPLPVSGRTLGYLLLGPKEAGEVFLDAEKRLIATVAPLFAMALHEAQLLAELRELNQCLVTAEEAERARIARDIHDGPLQKAILLTGVVGPSLDDPQDVARQLVVELRELCSKLRPAILDDLGLVPALEWLLEEAAKRFGVIPHLVLRSVDEDERLSEASELALFRVTQEALNNAIRHGQAESVDVSLIREDRCIMLTVVDDGSGFVRVADQSSGLGIAGMKERVRQLGGSVAVESRPGQGASIIARIPYRARSTDSI